MNRRDAILEGTQAAMRLHLKLRTRPSVEASGGGVDVFGALLHEHVALIFRPLQGLLGFCIKGADIPGVVISTARPLRIQRFTGAHELGHVVLGHTMSLDGEEILARRGSGDSLEIAADSFASEFLLPKWLLQLHAQHQGWNRADMSRPLVVYQLALRVGASYEATCIALERNKIIDANIRATLTSVKPRTIKEEILDGLKVENYHPDVWLLTERDEGHLIEGEPNDLFVLRLSESGGAGYLWNTDDLQRSGFGILRDDRFIASAQQATGTAVRTLTAKRAEPASGAIALEEVRPWDVPPRPMATFRVRYDLFGKESGMPRAVRKQLMAA